MGKSKIKSNNKVKMILIIVVIIVLMIFSILFAVKVINNNNSNDNPVKENNKKNNKVIQAKSVDTSNCGKSSVNFNGVNVNLDQTLEDEMCTINSLTINGKDIADKLLLWVLSYEIYDNNVLILSGDTSGTSLLIYNIDSSSVLLELTPDTLSGYFAQSFTTNNEVITINGYECGEQCGYESTEDKNAVFEIEYKDNSFSEPKLIKKSS